MLLKLLSVARTAVDRHKICNKLPLVNRPVTATTRSSEQVVVIIKFFNQVLFPLIACPKSVPNGHFDLSDYLIPSLKLYNLY
jgi:hypothetical protein